VVKMAAGKKKKETVILECTECKRRNYTYLRTKKATKKKLELRKYCKWCNRHTVHKETK